MCGKIRYDHGAQLALLDAMIFFAAALLVTSMLLGQGAMDNDAAAEGIVGSVEPANLLDALMRASIGKPLELPLDPAVSLSGYEVFSEVLRLELHELERDTPIEAFEEFNGILLGAVIAACGPALEPHVVGFREDGSYDSPLMAVPDVPGLGSVALASSMVLPGYWEERYVVVLVLDPAPPAE